MRQRLPVWDSPTRIFHWSLVISFVGAYLTSESEHWIYLHLTFGYTMLGLLVFRLIWGIVGTEYARFSQFFPSPKRIVNYFSQIISRKSVDAIGHNPFGALAIFGLIGLGFIICISGWLLYQDLLSDDMEFIHEIFSELMLAVVFIHVLGVLFSSFYYRENLILAMIDGKKSIKPEQAINNNRPWVAVLLLLVMLGFWFWRYYYSTP